MDLLLDAFEPAFMQRALVGALLAVVATSIVGTWVVLRGLAFLGDALAHGVIPGIALAVLVGFNPVIGAFAAALLMSGLVTVVSSRTTVREDTSIGLLFVGMLSLGIIIVSRARSFATEVTSLLFGDVLGVTAEDITGQLIATAVVLVVTVVLYRPFLALTFNRDKAQTLGMRPRLAQAAMLTLLAVSIVASFQAIGTLLVFGLLVGPPATASLLVRRVPVMMLVATLLGAVAVVHEAVGAGEVVQALAELLLARARADGVVGDGEVRGDVGQAGDGLLVEGIREAGTRAGDLTGGALDARRAGARGRVVGRRAVAVAVAAAAGNEEGEHRHQCHDQGQSALLVDQRSPSLGCSSHPRRRRRAVCRGATYGSRVARRPGFGEPEVNRIATFGTLLICPGQRR